MVEFTPDVVRNHILALRVPDGASPLSANELDQLQWRAKAQHASILNLPVPLRPGLWGKLKRLALRVYSAWLDRKAMSAAIAEQAHRICVLEDLLEAENIDIPGGRSDE